ncbi:uncharacterized protein LOC120810143 [Gasterosteus aculeatus]
MRVLVRVLPRFIASLVSLSASRTMLKGLVFLFIVWNSSASRNPKTHLLFSLGCQAEIPCPHYQRDSSHFKWLHEKGKERSMLYFKDDKGIEHYQSFFRSRMKVLRNGSLIIDCFTEADEGLYWCEVCFQNNWWNDSLTVVTVNKETLKETNKTVNVIVGISLTETCPGDFVNLSWTFEAPANSGRGAEPDFVTHNKSLQIVNVKKAHAGRYICWRSGCDGNKQKLFTVHLCVLTGHNSEASSFSCAVTCDVEVKANSTMNVETGRGTISVPVDPDGSLNCTATTQRDAFNNSTDFPTELGYLFPVTYGASAGLTLLILMSIFICYRRKSRAAFPVDFCCRGSDAREEEEISVVYSSTVFRRPAKTNPLTDSVCVYSEIRVA